MRELLLRQTATEELIAAQQAAIAGIGLRQEEARIAMRRARVKTLKAARAARWAAIIKAAKTTRFDALREDE
jgi:hypothetical protein